MTERARGGWSFVASDVNGADVGKGQLNEVAKHILTALLKGVNLTESHYRHDWNKFWCN